MLSIIIVILLVAGAVLLFWGLAESRHGDSPIKRLTGLGNEAPHPTAAGRASYRPQRHTYKTQRARKPQQAARAAQSAVQPRQGSQIAQSAAKPQRTNTKKGKYNLPSAY